MDIFCAKLPNRGGAGPSGRLIGRAMLASFRWTGGGGGRTEGFRMAGLGLEKELVGIGWTFIPLTSFDPVVCCHLG